MNDNSPILSICLSGRNDNYGFDFKRRFTQAMNFLAWSARRAGVPEQIEVVFADWNSDSPIAQELCFSPDAARMVRFIEIPPETANRYNPPFSPFSQSIAFNAAVRRARGKFLGIMPADILLTSHALRNLLGILSGKIPVPFELARAVISVPRKNIPYYAEEARRFSSPEVIESLLLSGDAWMLCDNTARGMMGSYGLFILERRLLYALRGVDERIAGWGYNDIDLALRCSDCAEVVNTMGYGVCSYDFEPSFQMLMQKEKRRTEIRPIHLGRAENTENWGLADQEFRESRAAAGERSYTESPQKPDFLPWRDWIIWLSQRVSPVKVPFFSSTALLAARIASRNSSARIFLYGTADRSILSLLALAAPFAELFIHELYETTDDYERIWHNDNAFGPQHHIGPVHYYPTLELIHSQPADLIVIDNRSPSMEALMKNANADSTVVISARAAKMLNPTFPEHVQFTRTRIRGNLLFQQTAVPVDEWKKLCAPMKGTIILRMLEPIITRHSSKIQKLWAIFFRQPLLSFAHTLSVIWKIHR